MATKQKENNLVQSIYGDQPNKIQPTWTLPSGDPPSDFDPIDLEAISGVLAATREVADVMRTAVDSAAPVINLLANNDPLSTAVSMLASTLNDTIDAILETGLYLYPIAPNKLVDLLSTFPTETALNTVAASVFDAMDSERPQAPDTSAYAGMVVLVGINEWEDFKGMYDLFKGLFGDLSKFGRIGDIWEDFSTKTSERSDPTFRATQGVGQDWYSWRIEEIDAVNDALLNLKHMININIGGLGGALQNSMRILQKRIAYIARVIEAAARLAEFISIVNQIRAKCLVLPLASQSGGVGGMVSDIVNSKNKPDYELCVGFVAVGFGADLTFSTQVKRFMQLWGVSTDMLTEMVEQMENQGGAQ